MIWTVVWDPAALDLHGACDYCSPKVVADRFSEPSGVTASKDAEGARRGDAMLNIYTAKYTKVSTGYMGQLVEWPEVITEGKTLEDCRESLQDALKEMNAYYRELRRKIPPGSRKSGLCDMNSISAI